MTPTRTVRKDEITANGHANGRPKSPDAASNDALLRELQALRRSEAVLRDFIETSTIGLHWVGADGTILWANQAELDLIGYVQEQYIGRNITEFHADEPVIQNILACLSRGETLRDQPARLRHRDGSIRHVLINSSVLFEDGEFVHTRCFTRDITDLKQEQETRQAQLAAELADTKLLRDISAQLIEPGDEDALYGKIVDAVAAIMRSDFATMQVLYPDRGPKGELRLLASRGLSPEGAKVWEWVRFDTDSTCGQVLRTGKRAIAGDVETCDFLAGTGGMAALLDAGIRAAQSTPLISRSGKMLGMISSHWRKPHAPTERDLRLLDILARQAADLIERRQADEALRESKRRLHEIIEAIPAAVYTTDAEGRITFFNQAAVEFSGRVPEVGTDSWCVTWKLYNMDSTPLPHDQCPMAVALREKRPVLGCEAIAERPDGQRRIFTPYPTPLFDDQGRLTGAVNMLVDITERKRAEDILRGSEERFRAIVKTTPECVKVVATDGTLLLMNEAGLEMVGAAAAEEVAGRSVYDLIAPEDRETYRAFNERVCEGEKGSLEFDIVGLKGKRCRMETHAVPLRRPDGSIVQLGITRDITGRRKAEETRLLLGAIVDSSDDAIISKDLGGRITSWNRGAERLYGYTAAEAIGESIMLVVPPDRQEEEREILARLQRGERVDHFETTRLRKDGGLLNVSLTISPLSNQQGEIIGVSKIARDITERKRAENDLRRANQDLEQFAYSASHDLQEPLRTIKIYSELLAGSLGTVVEGETAEFLEFLQGAATRMELLVRDLLAYTQVTKLDEKPEATDANQTLAEALVNLGGAITESGAAVTSDKLPVLRAHGTHLRQLFQNLIGNAIKYRSDDRTPTVHIGAERQDGNWVFTVSDNGIGISPEFKEQIFGLFTRLHNVDRYAGTGIGLAICQRIVERYHGRIWVESEPGRGSKFRFTLRV
ncbi:MAG: PAS domain S-box protein [Acidobacteriota bacterium]|nr:PAS domain S-box protein [Acidobacteriota bacterium]